MTIKRIALFGTDISRRLVARTVLLLTLVSFVASVFGWPIAAPPASARGNGMEVIGMLPEPTDEAILNKWIVGIDEKRRRMYYLWRKGPLFFLREYDLRPTLPRLLREVEIGNYADLAIDSASQYTMLLDYDRHRLLLLAPSQAGSVIRLINIKKLEVLGTWELSTVVPGFVGLGMTYSKKDDRIYIVGSQVGSARLTQDAALEKPGAPAAVVAIDASAPANAASPALAWARAIPECQQVMSTSGVGALIARSEQQKTLYFACVRPDPWPGESGLVRLWIDPKADQASATEARMDFFPVSGSYSDPTGGNGIEGMAAFDERTNRFFMHSIASATPGSWVFDGDLSAWVGFIAAPNDKAKYIGLDPSSGHYYMGSDQVDADTGYSVVSDARGTPVPQGDVYEADSFKSLVVVDPSTHRLFVKTDPEDYGLKGDSTGYIVLRDRSPLSRPPRPPDYDALTSDIPEGPKTITNYSGGINGFGARAVLVGGYAGALSLFGQDVQVGSIRPGDRGITAARVPSLDLRDVGASATAQAYLPDSNTEAELSENVDQEWPWSPASCLDGNGQAVAVDQSQHGGEAHVTCDLAKQTARATSTSSAFSAGGVVDLGASHFDSIVRRDAKKGIVSEAIAIAQGVTITTPGGSVSIDRVQATAATVAHGRPKTNAAQWERVLSGIELRDGEGKVVQRIPECSSSAKEDTCGPLIDEINDMIKTRARIDLPQPALIETPKGAFAGIQQSGADFYQNRTINNQGATFASESGSLALPALQVTVLNDSVEKSRLLVQLAAIQASSIYTISRADPPPTVPDEPAPPVDVDVATEPAGTAPAVDLSGGTAPEIDGAALAAGDGAALDLGAQPVATSPLSTVTAFLPRSLPDALLFAGFWSLFGAAAWTVLRRRSLLSILGGTSG